MRRRGFLGRLAAAAGLAAVVKPSESEAPGVLKLRSREVIRLAGATRDSITVVREVGTYTVQSKPTRYERSPWLSHDGVVQMLVER